MSQIQEMREKLQSRQGWTQEEIDWDKTWRALTQPVASSAPPEIASILAGIREYYRMKEELTMDE